MATDFTEQCFAYAPEYEYTPLQRCRLRVLNCFAKNIKACINQAKDSEPYQLTLIFCWGMPKYFERIITGDTDGRLIAYFIAEDFTEEDYKRYSAVMLKKDADFIRLLKNSAYLAVDSNGVYHLQEKHPITGQLFRFFDEEDDIKAFKEGRCPNAELQQAFYDWRDYEVWTKQWSEVRWTLFFNGKTPQYWSPLDVDSLIKESFPKGYEALGVSELALKVTGFRKGLTLGVDNATDKRNGIDTPQKDDVVCKDLHEYIISKLDSNGFIAIGDIMEFLQAPPYGMYPTTYLGYIIAYTLFYYGLTSYDLMVAKDLCLGKAPKEIAEASQDTMFPVREGTVYKHAKSIYEWNRATNLYYYDGANDFRLMEGMGAFGEYLLVRKRRKSYCIHIRNELDTKVARELVRIFHIQGYLPMMSTAMVVPRCIAIINNFSRIPVDLICNGIAKKIFRNESLYRTDELQQAYDFLTAIPDDFWTQYTDFVQLFNQTALARYCLAEASGWRWDKKALEDVLFDTPMVSDERRRKIREKAGREYQQIMAEWNNRIVLDAPAELVSKW